MAKTTNPNTKNNSDPFPGPGQIDWDRVRKQIDPDTGAQQKQESDFEKLDRGLGPERGGR